MSFDEIRKMVTNLKTSRSVVFNIFGGEPLLRNDILEIIDLILENLRNSSIAITTNGSQLQKYAIELLKRNTGITVSLDGISLDVNDKVRGAGTFQQTIDNLILSCSEEKGNQRF